jgi:ribosomal protein S12 methylthiotransferase
MSSVSEPKAQVYFQTLGCPKNEADSRSLMRRLAGMGVPVVEDADECTHVLLNTCGFIRAAKEESIEAILSACADHPGKKIMVMGCLVERYREELAEGIPEVAAWFGLLGEDLAAEIAQGVTGGGTISAATPAGLGAGPRSYAYLKVSDGCDEDCTFCSIPGIKGTYASVPVADIVREAEACLAEGARELVLVGQDTTRWRSDGLDLRGLIDLLASDERVLWIRVMYLQPARVSEPFLDFMAGHGKLCRYLDIPFQHCDRQVLERMGRSGEGASYLALLERARKLMPSVAARSTFIVGFPGETEDQFQELVNFVRVAGFDYGGAFIYSPEEGTQASGLRPVVRRGLAQRRLNLLNDAILSGGEGRRSRMVGSEVEVMIDSVGGEEAEGLADAVGRIQGQAPEVDGVTYVRGVLPPHLLPGDIVRVRVSEVLGCDLVGEICAA